MRMCTRAPDHRGCTAVAGAHLSGTPRHGTSSCRTERKEAALRPKSAKHRNVQCPIRTGHEIHEPKHRHHDGQTEHQRCPAHLHSLGWNAASSRNPGLGRAASRVSSAGSTLSTPNARGAPPAGKGRAGHQAVLSSTARAECHETRLALQALRSEYRGPGEIEAGVGAR